jgi:hypothetical protein
MNTVYTICREWGGWETWEYSKTFTTEDFKNLNKVLSFDREALADFMTGLNTDSYADLACEVLEANYEPEEGVEAAFNTAMQEDTFRTCEAWHRILNLHLEDKYVYELWKESSIETLKGIIEQKGL